MKTQKIKKSCSLKQVRRFSESIKKQVVKDIELGNCTVLAASRELMVSATSIYKWIYKYSLYLQKNKILVVQEKSESYKSKELECRIKELEAIIGSKQIELDIANKIIDIASEELKIDLKKNFSKKHSSGLDSTKE